AGLAGGLALGVGELLALGEAAIGQAGGRRLRRFVRGFAGMAFGRGVVPATACAEQQGGGEGEGEAGGFAERVVHGAAHFCRPERNAAISAMSWSEKLCACACIVGCLRVPLRYSCNALVR